MRVKHLLTAAFALCCFAATSRADLVVSATTTNFVVDTSASAQPVAISLRLAPTAGTQAVERASVMLGLLPTGGGGALFAAIPAYVGPPNATGFPDAGIDNGLGIAFGNAVFSGVQNVNTAGIAYFNVTLNIPMGVFGNFELVLVDDPSSYYRTASAGSNIDFANSFGGSFLSGPVSGPYATLATISAVPEASAYMFGGIASVLGGVVAWRRRSQAAVA